MSPRGTRSAAPPVDARAALSTPDAALLEANGLSGSDVAARIAAGLTNEVPFDTSRSFWRIVQVNLFTLFNAVVGGSFILLLVLGYWQDALFGFFIIANVLIGVVQEYRAKRTLDRLARRHSPPTRVLRDGIVSEIAPGAVVLDDAVVLQAGDQLSADAVVMSSTNLEVDEAMLTGEADAVPAPAGREVLSGSAVVGGHGMARVIRVGTDSFASQLTAEARRFTLVHSEIRAGLDSIIRWISWGLLPIGAIVVNGQMQAAGGWESALASGQWRGAVVSAIASIISMVPQGLVFITSVAFAVGAVKLARQNVLVQEIAAVEVLARVDVVCLDKTGTLTEGVLELDNVETVETVETIEPVAPVKPLATQPVREDWGAVLGWFGGERHANATAKALLPRFDGLATLHHTRAIPFASARKWSAVSFIGRAHAGTWAIGAPEMLLAAGVEAPASVAERATDLAASGLRTLLLVHSEQPLTAALAKAEQLPGGLRAIAIVTFREKTRPDAASTLSFFRDAGVQLRIISGDHPRTVAAVARDVGMELTGEAFDARELPEDLDELAEVLETHQVFGRVSSGQKKSIVIALQRAGHVVAMTGDGVNDALALKQADIGIAMGSGAATTRAVSRLVLLDGQFSHLPGVVAEGRQVIANVERLSKLFLTKTVYAILFAIFFGLALWTFPFLPRQLSAIDGLTIGIPALVLALLPNLTRYEPGFLLRAARVCIPFGLAVAATVITVVVYAMARGGHSEREVQGASVITLTLVALWVLVVLARPLSPLRIALIAAMYVSLAVVFTLPLLSNFFLLTLPPTELLLVALGVSAAGSLTIEGLHRRHPRRRRLPHSPSPR